MAVMSRLEMVKCSYAVSLNCAAILIILCSLLLKYRRDRISFFPVQDIPREIPAPILMLLKGSVPAPRCPRRCYEESHSSGKVPG